MENRPLSEYTKFRLNLTSMNPNLDPNLFFDKTIVEVLNRTTISIYYIFIKFQSYICMFIGKHPNLNLDRAQVCQTLQKIYFSKLKIHKCQRLYFLDTKLITQDNHNSFQFNE